MYISGAGLNPDIYPCIITKLWRGSMRAQQARTEFMELSHTGSGYLSLREFVYLLPI